MEAHSRSGRLRVVVLPGALLVAMAFVAHSAALRAGFVWDDDVYVTANPYLAGDGGLASIWLRPRTILETYPGRGIDALIPLTFTTLWVEHRLWGTDPLGYHAVNIALHALCAVLLWILLRHLGLKAAWLAAAAFAVHPVTVESVAWVAELKNVQSGVLGLLALLAYFRSESLKAEARGVRARTWYFLALASFAGALLSKPAVVPLPLVLLLLLWWRRGSVGSRDIVAVAPMLAMALVAGLRTLHAEDAVAGTSGAVGPPSLLARGLVAGRALWFYAGKLVWPAGLASIYPRWEVDAAGWWQYAFPLAAAMALAALWLLRGALGRGPLVGALSFAVLVGPTLGFVAVRYHLYSFVADHFQYHAAPALLALLAAGAAALHGRARHRGLVLGLRAAGGAALLALGAATWSHAQVFRSEEARCRDTIAKNAGAWLALNNLGVALASEGRPEEAIRYYEDALRVRPEYAEAHNNLGVALVALGRYAEAIEHYRAALAIWPTHAAAHNNLGAALASLGRPDEAIGHYRQALRYRPDYAEAHKNLGTALISRGQPEEAVQQYQAALQARPAYAEAHNDLGLALASAGRLDEAIGHYREALAIRPAYAECHNNLGMALAAAGKPAEAIEHYHEALRLKPGYAEAQSNLGAALGSANRPQEAIRHYREAVRVAPDSAEAHNNLGVALAAEGDLPGAIIEYREAVRLRPGHADAHLNLANALASTEQLDEAIAHYREVVRIRPGASDALNGLGVCLARQGRLAEATEQFEAALAADPGHLGARRNLERARGLVQRHDGETKP